MTLTPRRRQPKMSRPAQEPRVVRIVEQPAANKADRWAAALEILLEAGQTAQEDAR